MKVILSISSCRSSTVFISSRSLSSLAKSRQLLRYTPLDAKSNEIRLLTVLPASPSKPEELHCSLHHASLNSNPIYHALSYAWRDDALFSEAENRSPQVEIFINDARLTVGCNLASALKEFQSQKYRNIPIWIDAVCINQMETAERNNQILRMRDIYAKASQVTVWLGPEKHDSTRAIEFIRMMYERASTLDGWSQDDSEDWVRNTSKFLDWFQDSLLSRIYSREWKAVNSLLLRAWWQRIWIVQEMVAAEKVIFLCGSSTLDPGHLSGFLDTLVTHGVMYIPLLSRIERIVLDHNTFSLSTSYLRRETWKDVSLLQSMYRTGMALSSEPRDKIYAVLNLAKDGEKIVPHPDYSLSIEKIYKQLVQSMIRETGRVDVLSLAGQPVYPKKLDISLPTWTPDWTKRSTSTLNSSIADVRHVWAAANSSAVVRFTGDGDVMHARGFIIDKIDGLAQCSGSPQSNPAKIQANNVFQQSTSRSSMYIEWGAIDAIWRSLLGDLIPAGIKDQDASGLFLQQCRDPLAGRPQRPIFSTLGKFTFSEWYAFNRYFIAAGRTIEEWTNDTDLPWTPPSPAEANTSDLFDYRLQSHWASRRLLTTTRGYIGLGSNVCVPGDKICIVLGCCTPIILRQIDDHFEVVGEGYLHGVMHGEAMRDLHTGKYEVQDFAIW